MLHNDDFFGDVEIYRESATIRLSNLDLSVGRIVIQIVAQGCADHGICFLPFSQKLSMYWLVILSYRCETFRKFFCKRNMLVLLVIFCVASQLIYFDWTKSPVKRALEVPFLDLNGNVVEIGDWPADILVLNFKARVSLSNKFLYWWNYRENILKNLQVLVLVLIMISSYVNLQIKM